MDITVGLFSSSSTCFMAAAAQAASACQRASKPSSLCVTTAEAGSWISQLVLSFMAAAVQESSA